MYVGVSVSGFVVTPVRGGRSSAPVVDEAQLTVEDGQTVRARVTKGLVPDEGAGTTGFVDDAVSDLGRTEVTVDEETREPVPGVTEISVDGEAGETVTGKGGEASPAEGPVQVPGGVINRVTKGEARRPPVGGVTGPSPGRPPSGPRGP